MTNKDVRCWSCGKPMKDIGPNGYLCESCGSTWVDLPAYHGGELFSTEHNPATGGSKRKPSGSVTSAARRARLAKSKSIKGE